MKEEIDKAYDIGYKRQKKSLTEYQNGQMIIQSSL